MRTAWQIQMDYNRAMNAARRLRAIAGSMDGNANSMGGAINSINGSWDGENSDAYIAKGRKIQNNINTTADGIRRAASAIEKIARRTRDAELAAISIAGN